ncbi:MAG: rRNA pseudouridine synthase [Elusimicrobia bacterium]|nr:rRNA pseudouridine synthase [Elusimicrobiota bacterium]
MRLSLFIAKSGHASRRKADLLIADGKVRVNGRVVREPYFQVGPEDSVETGGKRLSVVEKLYLALNKPEGVTTTLEDRFADKKVTDLLPEKFRGVFPVGRLDKNSSGLLILTNDGDLCYRLTHPRFEVEKEYVIRVSGFVPDDVDIRARKGVIEGGEHLKALSALIIKRDKKSTLCRVVVCEGKKRHIRRLFLGLGFPVLELKRVRIAGLRLGDLKAGEYRVITKEMIG